MFFPLWRLVGPSQDGECGEQLTNMPFGAKYGGRHRQERALVLTSLRFTIRRCALATLSYDNITVLRVNDRQLAAETVARAQRRIVRRKLVNTNARS